MNFKNKKVLVYGLSFSGEWAARLLNKKKATVFLYDDNNSAIKNKNFKNCFLVQNLNESIIKQLDFIVVSPGIEYDNEYLDYARKNNIKVYSEMEFASLFSKNIIAITGTNGKTTTVELVAKILGKKYKTIACGNNGYPMSKAVLEKKGHIKVAEVSSFMLENCATFAPHCATILNIEPDHLIRHKTMNEYTRCKKNIFQNIEKDDYVVVNLDDKTYQTKVCNSVTYSYKKLADVYFKDGDIYLKGEKVIRANQLSLKGKHNILNVMCAICFAYIYKVPILKIRQALLEYRAENFRNQFIKRVNNINFVNDSKSTNIASTLASVEMNKGPIILLLGGSEKKLDYTKLFSKLNKRVIHIFAYGEIASKLVEANAEKFKIKKCDNLSQAFDLAVREAKENDTIILSPASASYDQFANFVERGKLFNEKVREYEALVEKK